MFDFLNFLELLNNQSIDKALESIKDLFHLAKIDVKLSNGEVIIEYALNSNSSKKPLVCYSNDEFIFEFYNVDSFDDYSKEQINDINVLLRLLSIHQKTSMLTKKVEDAMLINLTSHLPNTHGYMKNLKELKERIDPKEYNAYFINIKGFGLVNKLFGSEQGDKAICAYAHMINDFLSKDEAMAHLGGDNFCAFIKRKRHNEFVNLVTMCPVKIEVEGKIHKVNLIGVVGYVEINDDVISYANIMSNSSIACQYARATKKIVVKLTPELLEMVNSAKRIESIFSEELEKGNFVVYYQPKFDIKSGKIIGVEALSRWINNGNVIPPGVFVPILEKNGEIVNLDLFVLETLCKDIAKYRSLGNNIVPASCNLSRSDFSIPDIEDRVINIIKKYNVKTKDIVIEVTETTNLEENKRLAKFINTMNQNGIMTAIDDFGTGYSSLSVLRDFKVSEIKIDRSFINREILTDSDEIIIGSIIDMAKRLNINVICEGVETKSQAEFLTKLGCLNAQGFLYSKPIPKHDFEEMLQSVGTIYDK